MDTRQITALEKRLGYQFAERRLLVLALTHSSFANEQASAQENNERLEFLGDAVLELSISEELFERYPDAPEGIMTTVRSQLVSEPALAELARELDVASALFLGKGEENQGGRQRDSVLSDALESIFGAMFLDSGYDITRECILHLYADKWPSSHRLGRERLRDFKSRLQERTQQLFKDRPIYYLLDSSGPEHAKVYQVRVDLPDGSQTEASDTSVKKAEQRAAKKALEGLKA
jgi:ribonuclease-3